MSEAGMENSTIINGREEIDGSIKRLTLLTQDQRSMTLIMKRAGQ